ncbi:MAG: hypothetical protein JNK77_18570 [Saprospiraceae bacterium]|nr:hypothetical protein [Saprospiraceae bacterium]
MKKALKIIGVLFLMLILFRGSMYRIIIKYNEVGTRPEIEITNINLIEKIESKSANKKIGFKEIVDVAIEITNKELSFTTNRASNNPNELMNTKQANCVGYSAMFNSIALYLIRKNELQNEIEAEHKIGQLELFGINLHQYFENPFFRDHDFNEIIDKKNGNTILIDPSLSDYLCINRVAKNGKVTK